MTIAEQLLQIYSNLPSPETYLGLLYKVQVNNIQYLFEKVIVNDKLEWCLCLTITD